jgi:hypothetical protein
MPLLDLLIMTVWVFLFVGWVFLIVVIFFDIFRSEDLNGLMKAVWVLIVLIPLIGGLAYLAIRGGSMHRRFERSGAESDEGLHGYVHSTAGAADELSKLSALHDRGKLTDDEFNAQKAKLLG